MMKKIACSLAMGVLAVSAFAACVSGSDPSPGAGVAAQPALVADGPGRVRAALSLPASLKVSAAASGCSNSPGPFISLSGELAVAGVDARITLKNNVKGTHKASADSVADVVIATGEKVTFAKQPPLGGAGGNPFVYIEFLDDNGRSISNKILLGRCNQGLSAAAIDFSLLASADVDVSTDSCANSPGPFVTLSGELRLSGLSARITLQNNERGTHTTEPKDVTVDVILIPEGESITFVKQPPLGGAGGNPIVCVDVNSSSASLGDGICLGRCNQL
jgi:hypothetical protein